MTCVNVSVSVENVSTPIICVMAGFLQQKFGPLRVLMFCCVPYCFGWFITAMADSVQHLYLARSLIHYNPREDQNLNG